MPTNPQYPTRSQWRKAYNRRKRGYILAADRFIHHSPHEAPARIRTPYSASEWLALTPAEREAHVRKVADEFIRSQVGPEPEPASLTLSQLERRVTAEAEAKANDLRAVLKGTPDQIETLVRIQLPKFRADAFERLTKTHRIIEG